MLISLPYTKIDLKKSSVLSKWKIVKSDRTLDQVVPQPQVVSDADRFPLTTVAVIVATWFFMSLSYHVMTSSATDSRTTNHHLQIFLAIVNRRSIFAVNALQREKSLHNTKIITTTQ